MKLLHLQHVRVAILVSAMAANVADCGGSDPENAPSVETTGASSSSSRGNPSPTQTHRPSEAETRYERAEPGSKPDVTIRKYDRLGLSRATWTGPWPLDLAQLTLTNGRKWVVAKLAFTRFHLQAQTMTSGDTLVVYLDGNGDNSYEREIFVPWGHRGGLLTMQGDDYPLCRFKPTQAPESRTVSFRIPRNCFPYLTRMRARALFGSERGEPTGNFGSERYEPTGSWYAEDSTVWTGFAESGETVTITDPALPAQQD